MVDSKDRLEQIVSDLQSGKDLDANSRQTLIEFLQKNDTETRSSPRQVSLQSWKLNERIKELQCLYTVMDLLYSNTNDMPGVLSRLVELIPAGFVNQKSVHVRLEIGRHTVTTENFQETLWPLSATILTDERQIGSLTVYASPVTDKDRPPPFLEEESELISMLAKIISNYYEQGQMSSDLKQKEEFLYMFRLGIEYSDEAIFITDPTGKIIYVNSSFITCYGYSEEEVLGQTPRILKSGQSSDQFYEQMWKKLLAGEIATGEIVNRRKDGSLVEIEYSSNPIVNREGVLTGFLAIHHDVSERKSLEKQLLDYEQKLRDIVEHSTNLFYTHSPDHVLTYISPQAENFLGVSQEEALTRWTEFMTDHPQNESALETTMEAIRTGEQQPPYELELKRADGKIIWVEVNESPIVRDGETVAMAGSLTDITDRKRTRSELEESLREKNTLLSEIHHRVKNNLAVVSGMLLLQANEDEAEHEEIAERLFESVSRIKTMANIHEQLYQSDSFSKLEISENFKMLARDVINTFNVDIPVTTEFECPPINLNINQAIPFSLIFNEVLTNILKHAFVGRRDGHIRVDITCDGEEVYLVVRDNGIGLPEDFRVDGKKTLGMILIKLLALQIKAEYAFTSDGEGTRFEISFTKQDIKGPGSSFVV